MTIEAVTLQWIISGVFFLMVGLMIWGLNRAVQQNDGKIARNEQEVKELNDLINDTRLNMATNYVSKIDLEKQLEAQLSPIRKDMQNIMGDVKILLGRS